MLIIKIKYYYLIILERVFMKLIQKLKQFEKQIIFLRWASNAEYGKLKYVGFDYIEFQVLNVDEMEFSEIIFINYQLILEVVIGGIDVSRIIAEYSSKLPFYKQLDEIN